MCDYYTILRMHRAGKEDYKEICEDARLEDRSHFEADDAAHLRARQRAAARHPRVCRCPDAYLPDSASTADILTTLLESERCAIRTWNEICDLTHGKDPRTYNLATRILQEEIEHKA
jgi:ferritin-like protein